MSNRLLFNQSVRLELRALVSAAPKSRWTAMKAAWRRYRTRQRIAGLDSHLLKDIGVSYAEAETEANKPFWQV